MNLASQSEMIEMGSPRNRKYLLIKAVVNVSAVKLATVAGIQWVLFVNGSITVTHASCPDSNVGSLVMKSILTRSAHSCGVGNT